MFGALYDFAVWGVNRLTLLSLHRACLKILEDHPLPEPYTIPTDECDCVQVWDVLEPEKNVWRFIVYIEWLWRQPNAERKHLTLREQRRATYESCMQVFRRFYEETKYSGTV